jgi:hypothetical protein
MEYFEKEEIVSTQFGVMSAIFNFKRIGWGDHPSSTKTMFSNQSQVQFSMFNSKTMIIEH